MELTQLEPPQIEALWQEALRPAQKTEAALKGTRLQERRYGRSGARVPAYLTERAETLRAKLKEQLAEVSETFQTEFQRRGGWTRYFLVPGGHLHKLPCSTLTPGQTMVGLVIEASGMEPAEVIERFSYTACTHCFPEAPVEAKLTPEEEGFCPRSGEYLTKAQEERLPSGWHRLYRKPSVKCECGGWPAITASGKIRKHKPGRPQL